MDWVPPRAVHWALPCAQFALGLVFLFSHPDTHPVMYALTITMSLEDTDTESKQPVLLGAAQQIWPLAWRLGSRAVTGCYLHGTNTALGLCS